MSLEGMGEDGRPSGREEFVFVGESDFLLYSGLQLIGYGPSTLGRTICLTQPIIQTLILFKNILTVKPQIMFGQYISKSHCLVKLTYTFNYHSL